MRRTVLALALLLASLPALATAGPPEHARRDRVVTVMTRNLYLGADLTPAIVAPNVPALIGAVTSIFATVQASNIPERAGRLADEIAEILPDLVGLQEVVLWRSQTPADLSPTPNAQTVEFDFLQLLLDALEARGLSYEVAAVQVGTDVEAPALIPGVGCCREIRFTDREVILARRHRHEPRLKLSNARTGVFAANLALPLPAGVLVTQRGWASVDVKFRGEHFRFITTHLEVSFPLVQEQQGQELLGGPAHTRLPVILVCDCNSNANGSGTATYGNLVAAGFDDAWSLARPGEHGFTCCQAEDLRNLPSALTERIDLVLFRRGFEAEDAEIVGADPGDRTESGLWPSDHAGVAAALELSRRRHGHDD